MSSNVATKEKKLPVISAKRRKAVPRVASSVHKAHPHSPVARVLLESEVVKETTREPLGHLLIEHLLREAGFKGEVSTRPELLNEYSTDESIFEIKPQIVLQPMDVHDVEVAVTVFGRETKRFPSLSLTPRSAGTGLGGGSLTDSAVIDIKKHLNKTLRVGKENGRVTFTCEPGAMWKDVEAELKKYDSYIPSFPASKHICTIGGAVANNAAGPDSLRYGHTANWVESLDVVLRDGKTYTVRPLSFKEFKSLLKEKNELARIAKEVFALIKDNETTIKRAKPKTAKNTAGYALWNVIDTSVRDFEAGKGKFDLTKLIAGSQGTIGIIVSVTMKTEPIAHDTALIAVPVFDLASAGKVVLEALKFNPINLEVFDALTYDAAMKNPQFFRTRLSNLDYYRVLLSLYTTYHVRWRRKLPQFVLLITLDQKNLIEINQKSETIVTALRSGGGSQARLITNPYERQMFWQVRDASFLLAKLLDPGKRPAAFLEDMTVPPENIAKFFADIKLLLKKYNVTAAVHGHGGNAHFHFYPLLDFTNKTTPALVMKMAEEFFATAIKYGGNICGEHNDGIIRTPFLSLMFSKGVLDIFRRLEHIFDPEDIFNPGKKVNPRFDIRSSIRKRN